MQRIEAAGMLHFLRKRHEEEGMKPVSRAPFALLPTDDG
jgi:hypothetical protein